MFLELVATLVAGVAGAGVMLLLNRLTGQRLPRWLTPLAAGIAMLGVTIANEYSWFPRTAAQLPAAITPIDTVESTAWYRPWTYPWPYVERFVALDSSSLRQHPGHPGQHMAEIYLFGRWAPTHRLPVLVDCPGQRRAALADGVEIASDGRVEGIGWTKAPAGDPLLAAICGSA